MAKSRIEMTIICNSLHDAAMIEEVVKGTASTYAIRTVNGNGEIKHDTPTGRTVVYTGGKKDKGISGKDCIVEYAKSLSAGKKFTLDQLVVHGNKYKFAPNTMSSKVALLVNEGRVKREARNVFSFVK